VASLLDWQIAPLSAALAPIHEPNLPDEAVSEASRSWLDVNGEGHVISHWVIAEVASALSMKVRIDALTTEQRADVKQTWQNFQDTSLSLMEIRMEDFKTAARFSERHDLNLRASDALHIAVAYASDCTLITLDKRIAEAAVACGVVVEAVGG
jgi:uncharacterized protein